MTVRTKRQQYPRIVRGQLLSCKQYGSDLRETHMNLHYSKITQKCAKTTRKALQKLPRIFWSILYGRTGKNRHSMTARSRMNRQILLSDCVWHPTSLRCKAANT